MQWIFRYFTTLLTFSPKASFVELVTVMRINASYLLNAPPPPWTLEIKKTLRAFIGSFTVCLHKVATTIRKPALRWLEPVLLEVYLHL